MTKLYKTKYYLVDLDTREVQTDEYYDGFCKAVDDGRKKGMDRYTALKGTEIKEFPHVWKVPG